MDKKIYHKPQVYVESFQLMEHIALGCGLENLPEEFNVTQRNGTDCYIEWVADPGYRLFLDVNGQCNENAYGENQPTRCYNGPAENGLALFAS